MRKYASTRMLQRYAIVACAGLVLALVYSYVDALRTGAISMKQTDFISFYSASSLVAHGHGGSMYNFSALASVERTITHPLSLRDGVLPYVYPPYLAVLLAPVAHLPFDAAYIGWFVINCALLLFTLVALQRIAGLSRTGNVVFLLGTISFLPVFVDMLQGQWSLLILFGLTASFYAIRSGRLALSGLCLSLTLVKPQYAIPFIVLLLIRRHWTALATLAAGVFAFLAVPIPVLGFSINASYARVLTQATRWHNQFGYGPRWNHSLAGFFQLLVSAPASTVATIVFDLAALALLAHIAMRVRSVELPFALATVIALLISPHVLIHDLTLLVLPVVVALRHREAGSRYLALLLAIGYTITLFGFTLVAIVPIQFSVVAMVALAGWLYIAARTEISVAPRRSFLRNKPILEEAATSL